ncbi:tape measure protein [Paenibacillus phocaensis]|uniref:tape measure protein n=1 Tax=Paenibacillus phocaensis TaxID=1776378 RepID=UPI000839BE6D|nr:tape measure protein [Paenibacillus phocaensis]
MATVSSTVKMFDAMSGPLKSITNGMNLMISTMYKMQQATNSNVNIDKTLNAAKQQIASAEAEINRQIQKATESQNRFNQSLNNGKASSSGLARSITGIVAAYLSVQSLKSVLDLSDTYSNTTARLNLMNDGLQTTAELQDKIMESANRARASYQTTADVVAKLGQRAGDVFKSNDETIQFAENLNKQFVIAGASQMEMASASLQLTQALGSGVLRGEELNAVFEAAPNVIQTIADYMNVPIGKIRDMASDGEITASIVKNAMLSATDEINKKFESMPMTFAQVWALIQNILIDAFAPLLQTIGKGAQFIYDNWSKIEPVLAGAAAGAVALAVGLGIQAAATWIATGAASAFFATLLSNPLTWIVVLIGLVVMAIYKWVKSVGGLKIAWMIVVDALLTGWDWVKYGFYAGVYWVMNLFNEFQLSFMRVSTNIQNFMGDMKAGVLSILQNMVNGAIDIINDFINTLNKIPGVSIDLVDKVTFGAGAQLINEAQKQARNAELAKYSDKINSQISARAESLEKMASEAKAATAARKAEIAAAQAEKLAKSQSKNGSLASGNIPAFNGGTIDKVNKVGKIEDTVDISSEDLKLMRELAEMKSIQNFVTYTPTVQVTTGPVSKDVDIDEVVARIEQTLEEDLAANAAGVYA